MKEQDKIPEKHINKMEISNLPDKELKVRVKICSLNLGKWMNIEKTSTKRQKIIRKHQRAVTELKNAITEQ